MRYTGTICWIVFLIAAASSAWADDVRVGDISVIGPWARASAGPARTGAAYINIFNNGAQIDRLINVVTPVARNASLHTHMMEGDIMKMRSLVDVDVSPGETTIMKPGGLHVMLMGLKSPLKEGNTFPLTLTFEKAGTIEVIVNVRNIASMGRN